LISAGGEKRERKEKRIERKRSRAPEDCEGHGRKKMSLSSCKKKEKPGSGFFLLQKGERETNHLI